VIQRDKYNYLIKFQYLGFRFHGWQKQTETYRTVQGMLERTLNFIFEKKEVFKTLGASRTDAMVSAMESYCKLTTTNEFDPDFIFTELNKNLPQDIKALSVEKATPEFQIINDKKVKTYQYFFSNVHKPHPFSAPFITNFPGSLDMDLMHQAARIYEGHHNFSRYCFRPNPDKIFEREIISSFIKDNTELTASFFPKTSYIYEVCAYGFLRNQIRIMMGSIVSVGLGKMSIEELKASLVGEEFKLASIAAPASGLMLKELNLQASD